MKQLDSGENKMAVRKRSITDEEIVNMLCEYTVIYVIIVLSQYRILFAI